MRNISSLILYLFIITNLYAASNDIDQLSKNALIGSTDAQNQLGEMYFEGVGVLQDYTKAHAWYRIMTLYGVETNKEKLNQLQQLMTDDEIYEALVEYNNIFKKISELDNENKKLPAVGLITDCEIAKNRMLSLERIDQNNFEDNQQVSNLCQLAEHSLTIWTEIKNIVAQCPKLDSNGSDSQYANESIHWAKETKLRTCSN